MLRIYNSLGKKKEEFKPIEENKVKFYVCGPTVYDVAHLGHGRSAVCFDVIRKYFEYKGYDVHFVSNYTDIDDKMINRANEEGISVSELAERIIPEYKFDYEKLGVKPPSVQPKATEHIDQIIKLIEELEEKNMVYTLPDGIYFDINAFPGYGKLSGQNLEDLRMGARVEVNELKRNPYDFAVWKFRKEGEPYYESPWGEGRPGWHIECSAMAYEHLGSPFDIHGGGLDLTFPHHECEIAQSEGALGENSFAKYWIHNGFINVDGEKMSKSLNNFSTLKAIFENYSPTVVRFMLLQTHYRNPIDFSQVLLTQSRSALDRIHGFVSILNSYSTTDGESNENILKFITNSKASFEDAMDDDFDTSGALGSLFDFIKKVNIYLADNPLTTKSREAILEFLQSIDRVLGIIFITTSDLDADIEELIKERNQARENRDFETSDRIRDELLEKGIVLEDTPSGTIWKKKN
ncbi:cysteine--tRNA ligase [Candidatus Peregrinibacteria bacterium]|nr:cysteine--tRNA ligase [Candidatus Peregrinibacteria bacterium]